MKLQMNTSKMAVKIHKNMMPKKSVSFLVISCFILFFMFPIETIPIKNCFTFSGARDSSWTGTWIQ